jgi:predicted permease
MIQDLRYGVRVLRKNPGFTSVAVLTLALGIGVNTALFTFFNTLLRPLPLRDPDTIVQLRYVSADRNDDFSFPDYSYLSEHTKVFSGLAARSEEKFLLGTKSGTGDTEEITGTFVSDNYFKLLGGGTILGRTFAPEEGGASGEEAVIMLSHRYWQRRFGGDPLIVGKNLLLNGRTFTVIGVAEPDFRGSSSEQMPELWLPLSLRKAMPTVKDGQPASEDWFGKRTFQWLNVVGRLGPGRTAEEGRAEMAVLFSQLARAYPEIDPKDTVIVSPLSGLSRVPRNAWRVFGTVFAATGIVLLIACSNLANLLLSRAAARQKEIGVRHCLGASRGRVIRQLLIESLLLAGLGGFLGLLLSWWCMQTFSATVIASTSGQNADNISIDFTPDWRILTFTFLITLLSGVVFGLAPALRATRADLFTSIKDEGAAFGQRLSRSWLRNGLVVAQVALSLLLLIPA